MTPKEKAIELIESMAFSCRECDYEVKAKQCALIAVDEILKVAFYSPPDCYNFYLNVKVELDKL